MNPIPASSPPPSNALARQVAATIAKHKMVRAGENILVAVSGGADSVALLDVLILLAPGYGIELGVAHVNHALRGAAADGDAAFVAGLARQRNLPFFDTRVDIGAHRQSHRVSTEEAGRQLRYAFLNKVADDRGYTKIALGHQRDDNAELVLMFLLRGSGPRGLGGIPPTRGHRIIRPLIDATRAQVMAYLGTAKLTYTSDATNTDRRYLRNRIRHDLLPLLRADYNPQISRSLTRLAAVIRSEDHWMDRQSTRLFAQVVRSISARKVTLDRAEFGRHDIAVRRRMVRKAIVTLKGDLRRVTFTHVEAVCRLADRRTNGQSVDLPQAMTAAVDGATLVLARHKCPPKHRRQSPLPGPAPYGYDIPIDQWLPVPEIGARIKCTPMAAAQLPKPVPADPANAYLDRDRLPGPLRIRNIRPGDRFRPLGLDGSQKIKNFLINTKVNRAHRSRIPVVESGARIVWLVGHRIAEDAKIRPETRRVLKVEFFLPPIK